MAVVAVAGAGAASAARSGPALPIASLKIETTMGGEPVVLELGEDGRISGRGAFQQHAQLVGRIDGPRVLTGEGQPLATLGPGGRIDAAAFERPLRVRGCTLIDDEGAEYTVRRNGDFWLKPAGQKRFPLPAHVDGDVRRACPTALLLYRMLPFFLRSNAR
ncbi:MAG TPA: hypothetical protein VIF57_03995 [Polyangia bacterium]